MKSPSQKLAEWNEMDKLRTPGQWDWENSGDDQHIAILYAHLENGEAYTFATACGGTAEQQDVDAEFIAAAPEILSTLNHYAQMLDKAREVLRISHNKAATGRQMLSAQNMLMDVIHTMLPIENATKIALAECDPHKPGKE